MRGSCFWQQSGAAGLGFQAGIMGNVLSVISGQSGMRWGGIFDKLEARDKQRRWAGRAR